MLVKVMKASFSLEPSNIYKITPNEIFEVKGN